MYTMLIYIMTAMAGIALGILAKHAWDRRASLTVRTESQSDPGDTKILLPEEPKSLSRYAMLGAGGLLILSVGATYWRGEGQASGAMKLSDGATATGPQPAATGALDDVDAMIDRLAKRLESNPTDGEGFRMLGWSYVNTGKPQQAIAPYKRATELLPGRADVWAGYGEALTGAANGTVTDEAKRLFDKALKLDAREPRARFFHALHDVQNGRERAGLDRWIALANDGQADAPWQTDLHQRIDTLAAKLGVNIDGRLKGAGPGALAQSLEAANVTLPPVAPDAVAAASAMSPTDRQAMVDKMVEGLAAKLAAQPNDADGWIKLLRSRMVLQQADKAARDLTTARKALAGSSASLAKVETAAKTLGVPGS
jgi:cytochrome c-type biogenesis protein CcmH